MVKLLRLSLASLALLTLGAALGGCAGCEPLEPLSLPDEHCQPLLAGADCMLPYPSDFFRKADASAKGGFRVEHQGSAKMLTADGYSADVNDWRVTDGFSRAPPILALLGAPVADEGLVHIFDERADSTRPESKTLLLDTVSGELVPHFVDLDPRADDRARQAIILRPEVVLEERRRYVVALQGFTGDDGELVPAPEGFRRLREGRGADDPALAPLAAHYEEQIFPLLEKAGVERAGLQLAWDFTTGADESVHDDMLRARELALEWLEENEPSLEGELRVVPGAANAPNVWFTVYGTLRGPLVLEEDRPGASVARDDEGRVRLNGETTFDFRALVPVSVRDRFEPGLLLHYGHGFFGGQEELEGGGSRAIHDRVGAVGFAIDWVGMSGEDLGEVIAAVGERVDRAAAFSGRVPQAMVNWLVLTAAVKGPLASQAAFQRPTDPSAPGVVVDPNDPESNNAGALVYDPSRLHFLGISMGHILGGTLAALNPDLERAVLHVGGAGFSQMMFRALPFDGFLAVMKFPIPDPLDQQKLSATMQRHLDAIDPITWARYVLDEELPSGPPGQASRRRVLLQVGIADTQVPNFATYLHARALGAPLIQPKVESVWGLEPVSAPHGGSGLFQFDLGVDPSFYEQAQSKGEKTIVHDELRLHPEPSEQMRAFFEEGRIVSPCDAACALTPF